jgi:hypothetical protein
VIAAGKARARGARWDAARKEAFTAMWNAEAPLTALCDEFDLPPSAIGYRAAKLRKEGFDIASRRGGRVAGDASPHNNWDATRKMRFVKAWNAGVDVAALDDRFGLSPGGANRLARRLRREGHPLAARRGGE